LILIGCAVGIWDFSAKAFLKTDRKNKTLGDLQVATVALRKAAWSASRSSFSFLESSAVNGLSFLSPRSPRTSGVEGVALEAGSFGLVWRKYEIFYLDRSAKILYQRELPLADPAAMAANPVPIELCDTGAGFQNLPFYCQQGRKLCTGVTQFRPHWSEGGLSVMLEGLAIDSRSIDEEKVGWNIVLWPRN
jgi:hypothetical protein